MRPKRHTRMRDQHKNDVDPKLINKKKNTSTHKDTRESLLDETLEESNIRITRRTKMKESQKVDKLSPRFLQMIEKMKKKNIAVNIMNSCMDKECTTGECFSLNNTEDVSISIVMRNKYRYNYQETESYE